MAPDVGHRLATMARVLLLFASASSLLGLDNFPTQRDSYVPVLAMHRRRERVAAAVMTRVCGCPSPLPSSSLVRSLAVRASSSDGVSISILFSPVRFTFSEVKNACVYCIWAVARFLFWIEILGVCCTCFNSVLIDFCSWFIA